MVNKRLHINATGITYHFTSNYLPRTEMLEDGGKLSNLKKSSETHNFMGRNVLLNSLCSISIVDFPKICRYVEENDKFCQKKNRVILLRKARCKKSKSTKMLKT